MIYVYGDENASKMNFEIFAIRNSCKNAVPKYTLDAYEKAYTHTHTPTDRRTLFKLYIRRLVRTKSAPNGNSGF